MTNQQLALATVDHKPCPVVDDALDFHDLLPKHNPTPWTWLQFFVNSSLSWQVSMYDNGDL